jgi:DNA-binding MarR family transcriptional regulator
MSYAVPRELQIQLLYMQITGDMRMASGSTLKPLGCSNSKLRQLTRRVSQHYDHRMGEIGLKATQFSLLSNVLQHGPIRPGNLAKAMALDASTLTRNLKPLLAAGWLTIGAGTDDRSHLITLTRTGRGKLTVAQRRWKVAQESLNELLGVERVLALHELIDGSLQCFAEKERRSAS